MNAIFPIFTCLALAALIQPAIAQFPLRAGNASPAASQRQAAAPESISGDALVRRALAATDAQPSIASKVRQKVDIQGISLIGSGLYRQQGRGVARKLCFELELQTAGGKPSVVKHVCDGRSLWIYENLTEAKSLARVDLASVVAARPKSPANTSPTTMWLALGGVPHVLESLLANFDFAKVSESRLGEVRVWTIEGTWKRPTLIGLVPSQKTAIESGQRADLSGLPPYLPARVVVHIGCDDFFPYRFEYWRDEAARKDNSADARLLTVIEFYEVQFGLPIEASQFVLEPGDVQPVDRTQAFLEKLGLESALPAGATQQAPARR